MPITDKNYKSFELLVGQAAAGERLVPHDPLEYDDTMKAYKCERSTFSNFYVSGGKEDCLDVGRETFDCTFQNFMVLSNGQYVGTIKGGSHRNLFRNWRVLRHGKTVDFEIGNWSTYNFEKSTGNIFENISSDDGKPVTYCYRLGCKPTVINSNMKHLRWRSIGLTVYWHFKYVKHVILKRPDNMGHPTQK